MGDDNHEAFVVSGFRTHRCVVDLIDDVHAQDEAPPHVFFLQEIEDLRFLFYVPLPSTKWQHSLVIVVSNLSSLLPSPSQTWFTSASAWCGGRLQH